MKVSLGVETVFFESFSSLLQFACGNGLREARGAACLTASSVFSSSASLLLCRLTLFSLLTLTALSQRVSESSPFSFSFPFSFSPTRDRDDVESPSFFPSTSLHRRCRRRRSGSCCSRCRSLQRSSQVSTNGEEASATEAVTASSQGKKTLYCEEGAREDASSREAEGAQGSSSSSSQSGVSASCKLLRVP